MKRLPGEKTDLIGSEGALSTDLLGMNDEWPVAGHRGRKKILEDTKRFTKGFLWFLATDEAVPVSGKPFPCLNPILTMPPGTHPQGMVSIWVLPRRIPRQRPLPPRALRPRRAADDIRLHHHGGNGLTRRRPGGSGPGRRGVLADRHAQRAAYHAGWAGTQRGLHLQGWASVAAVRHRVPRLAAEAGGGEELHQCDVS